jgi:hypothetical protein
MFSKSSQNYFLTSSLKPTYGAYILIIFMIKSPIINSTIMIMSSCLLIVTSSLLSHLSIKMHISFLFRSFSVHHNLNLVFSTFLVFEPELISAFALKPRPIPGVPLLDKLGVYACQKRTSYHILLPY